MNKKSSLKIGMMLLAMGLWAAFIIYWAKKEQLTDVQKPLAKPIQDPNEAYPANLNQLKLWM